MLNTAKTQQNSGTPAQRGRYFKVQIRVWTDFDPMDKKLPEIAEAIERGGGLLTAIEVLQVEDDLMEELRSALNAREEFGRRKPASPADSQPASVLKQA